MKTHPLGGRTATRQTVQAEMDRGTKHVQRIYLDQLFPHGPQNLKERALTYVDQAILIREWQPYQPSLAYLNLERKFLVTDEKRFQTLPPEKVRDFVPVLVLESRSHRARFWVDEEGRAIEFKGLTPSEFNKDRINPNSGQPEGLFDLECARAEVRGINLIGELESGLTDLGEYFADLGGYAQIYRTGMDGNPYVPFARLDLPQSYMQTLADLEGVPLERYFYEAALRFGLQLRKLHDAGQTLHIPYPGCGLKPEPFFSVLHSGNVEVHGNIIDLEGMKDFRTAEKEALRALMTGQRNLAAIPPEIIEQMKQRPFEFFSRMSDLQRLIGGTWHAESSLFGTTCEKGKNGGLFVKALSAIILGYYGPRIERVSAKLENTYAKLRESLSRETDKDREFAFPNTFHLFSAIEDEIRQ